MELVLGLGLHGKVLVGGELQGWLLWGAARSLPHLCLLSAMEWNALSPFEHTIFPFRSFTAMNILSLLTLNEIKSSSSGQLPELTFIHWHYPLFWRCLNSGRTRVVTVWNISITGHCIWSTFCTVEVPSAALPEEHTDLLCPTCKSLVWLTQELVWKFQLKYILKIYPNPPDTPHVCSTKHAEVKSCSRNSTRTRLLQNNWLVDRDCLSWGSLGICRQLLMVLSWQFPHREQPLGLLWTINVDSVSILSWWQAGGSWSSHSLVWTPGEPQGNEFHPVLLFY